MTVSFHIRTDRRARVVIVSVLSYFVFDSVRSSTTLNGFPEFLPLSNSSPFAVTVPLRAIERMHFGKIIITAFCGVTPCSLGEMLCYTL